MTICVDNPEVVAYKEKN